MNKSQYVVDASVVAKWVLPGEPFQDNAVKLKEDHVSGIVELCAPKLLAQEVANALWKAVKLGRIADDDGQDALKALGDIGIGLHDLGWVDLSRGLCIACKYDLTVYDAAYLVLTEKTKARFITADDKLYEKAKKHFEVLHIKNYPK